MSPATKSSQGSDVESIQESATLETVADSGDEIYQRKATVLNEAMQTVGMGKYQWWLFVVTGFGWFADNLWPIVTSLILAPVIQEFQFEAPYLKLGQNVGLLVGAIFWSLGADVWGRRFSFNITFFIIGAFALAAGGSQNDITLISLIACWSVGVGGNLPVDSAIFLEGVPASHQYLLTVLSIWWSLGQLVGSLIAWPLIGNSRFSCEADQVPCLRKDNWGWRYFLFLMGGLMIVLWAARFFLFTLHESPKYLMGRGRDADAVRVLHEIALFNGKEDVLTLSEEDLTSISGAPGDGTAPTLDTSALGAVRRKVARFSMSHIKTLFATRKLAYSTTLVIILWALIGLAFPLYNSFVTYYLATRGADFGDGSVYITYRNQVILSVIGVPGAVVAGYLVELPSLGRRGTLSVSTILTGVFLFASTTARSSPALLGWNCAYSFTSNIMYGVLYAFTPEVFPTKARGTGNGLAAAANRVFGIMAPIIALYGDLTTSVPIFVSGALFLAAGVIALLLPYESRGKAAL